MAKDHLTPRARRMVDELRRSTKPEQGLADALLYLAAEEDSVSRATLLALACELRAPSTLDRALAGDANAAKEFLFDNGFIDEDGNIHPRYR
jgi:hypothetical protein